MPGHVVQIMLIFIFAPINIQATKPPGFVAPPKEYDPNPPKYEYGYRIQDDKVTQGKDEQRDGIYAQGRYYVENGTQSSQQVRYFADDWGYHPVVEYTNASPHSKSSANFALGEEAIKLKNNKKSIPQDPSDPGKAENLFKLGPSNQQVDPALRLSKIPVQPQLTPTDSVSPLQSLILQQQDPTDHSEKTRTNFDFGFQTNSLNDPSSPSSHLQQLNTDPENQGFQPPNLQLMTSDPSQNLQNRHLIVDYSLQQQTPTQDLNSKQPVFYFIQTQQQEDFPNIRLNDNPSSESSSQRLQLLDVEKNQQHDVTSQKSEDQNYLQQLEPLPKPEALIINHDGLDYPSTTSSSLQENAFDNDNEHSFERAALVKAPNQLLQFQNPAPDSQYIEFGTRLNPRLNTKKLIESTRNLVSGADVLNLNAAISHADISNDGLESSTLHNLLRQYVSPTLSVSTTPTPDITTAGSLSEEPIVVADSELDSEAKPVTEKTEENKEHYSSTARNFIASSTLKTGKQATENPDNVLVTPRPVSSKFLAPITAGVQLQQVEEQISEDSQTVETHGKTSVQIQKTIPYYLGMYEYPLGFDISATEEKSNERAVSAEEKAVENIELGKTLLYFPDQPSTKDKHLVSDSQTQILNDINSNHLSHQHQAEFGEQQLNQEKGQLLVKDHEGQQNDISEDQTPQNLINVEQIQEYQLSPEKAVEGPVVVTQVVERPVPYPVEKIVERPVQVPVEVTKYVDRPYPVEVPVPYPQPYAVEKVVQHIVKQPYPVEVKVPVHVQVPVEKIVERKVPVPYFIEKPVEKIVEKPVETIVERKVPVPYFIEKPVDRLKHHYIDRPFQVPVKSQAYLLQIPGLFSKQKYSTLVQNSYKPSELQVNYFNLKKQQSLGHSAGQQYFSYAPQNNQYLPPKQNIPVHNGRIPTKLRKLNLLVFPRQNIANLPPVTNNPHDLYRTSLQLQSARFSNAQLNNGYLPPLPLLDNNQAEGSSRYVYNVKKPEDHIGLIPPKRPLFTDAGKNRISRSHFDDSSIRMEYGFMPPLIPSLEIDEQGRPIEKDDNKK